MRSFIQPTRMVTDISGPVDSCFKPVPQPMIEQ